MKTEAWIDLLARGAGPAPRPPVARRLALAAGVAVVLSTLLALLIIGPVPLDMFATPAPWLKLGYAAALAGAGAWLAGRLARPVARLQGPWRAVAAVLAAMLLIGLGAWLLTPAGQRLAALTGHSWQNCPFNVLALSLPGLGAALWAMRGLAPTRLRAAGAAAGLVAGSAGAFGYAFSCTEYAPSFVAVWYTLGIGLTALVGAVLGPRVLRW